MDATTVYVLLVVTLLVAAAASPGIFILWLKTTPRQKSLELWTVMRRFGLELADAAGRERELGAAASLCVTCRNLDACREWIAAGKRDGLDAFCPNAGFLASLGEGSRLQG